MRHCQKCNEPNVDEALTCRQCGTKLQELSGDNQTIDVTNIPKGGSVDIQVTLDLVATNTSHSMLFDIDEGIDTEVPEKRTVSDTNLTVEYTVQDIDGSIANLNTVMNSDDASVHLPNDQTLLIGPDGTNQNAITNENSGTADRLKRIWAGAAGASANPMHSLSAASMQASETIFERVATRKVHGVNGSQSADADYQIVNKLGEGGMGIVFTARQSTIDRLVALKAAKPKFQKDQESRRRFLYEAQITADLDHSNIIPIHELGVSEEGMLFYSMKIVDGDQWSRVIRQNTREQNIDIFMKVADAVAFAHSKGIIHRDLKPENTMLGRFGEVFVTDWGTAVNLNRDSSSIIAVANKGDKKLFVENADYFRAGELIAITTDDEVLERNEISAVRGNEIAVRKPLSRDYHPISALRIVKVFNLAGTPCYMAPEMAGHQLNKLGRTSDIYVLGAILFDMVTGSPPHTGPTVTHCLQHALTNEVVVPKDAEDDALLKIAVKAMATEPEDRYRTVEQMQDAIRQYRRHAESISLAERSSDFLEQAKATGDYQTYSRAMFGFRDAIELWPENTSARDGLLAARREYGEAAFGKGDFDLVCQTVDQDVPEENELFQKAKTAKQRRIERESRIRNLQRSIVTVVMFAVVGLSGLLLYALSEQRKAMAAANAEKEAKLEADEKRLEVEQAMLVVEQAKRDEEEQRKLAVQRQSIAEIRQKEAEVAQEAALSAEQDAQRKAVQIQLDEYKSSIALASSRLASFDLISTREILDRLMSKAKNISETAPPAFDTWGWRRINLLTNADLLQVKMPGLVVASSTAIGANVIALATDSGNIQVISVKQGTLSVNHTHIEHDAKISSLALSADGSQLAYAYSTNGGGGIKFWQIGRSTPELIRCTDKKVFQQLAISRDSRYLIAGINAGLWIWNTETKGWQERELPSSRLNNVRGELVALQQIGEEEFLLTTDFNKSRELRLVDIMTGDNKQIDLPESMQGLLVSCLHLGNREVALGLSDNRIAIAKLENSKLVEESYLESKHSAAITKIIQDTSGRVISMSDAEPVAQVWQNFSGQWQHLNYLAGLKNNLVDILAITDGSILALDSSSVSPGDPGESHAIVWDIKRQIQRNRMERPKHDGRDISYPESVQHIAVGDFGSNALTVDKNGCVSAWSLLDGQIAGSRFAYLGHTPGAELVDSATSLESQVMVTAAKLRPAQRSYLVQRDATWEFCQWDLVTKQMVRRWTRTDKPLPGQSEAVTVEPRLTLIDSGQKLLIGSDTDTSIIDVKTGNEIFSRSDWGTYFAIQNPKKTSQLLLIKRSGAVRLMDIEQLRWNEGKVDDSSSILASDSPPIQAAWSPTGNHFYFVYANGDVARLAIVDRATRILWHSRSLSNSVPNSRSNLKPNGGEVRLHTDMDLVLQANANSETLHYAVRSGSSERRTYHVSIEFKNDTNRPLEITQQNEPVPGNRWLRLSEANTVSLVEELHEQLAVDNRRVRIMQQLGPLMFVSSRTAQMYAIKRDADSFERYTRSPVLFATGDRSGRLLYVMHTDGQLTRYRLNDGKEFEIDSLNYSLPTANEIRLSGDARYLAVLSEGNLDVQDPESGSIIKQLRPVAAFTWSPQAETQLATCTADGNVTLYDNAFRVTNQLQYRLEPSERIVGLHFLTETYGNPTISPRRHLIVHTRTSSNDYANLLPVDPLPDSILGSERQISDSHSEDSIRQLLQRNSLIAVSPTEGVFATGSDNGTVNVWFCAPTWGKPRELFDLTGHRGAKITSLIFTTDGRTLLTADDKKRLYAWLSIDPQENGQLKLHARQTHLEP